MSYLVDESPIETAHDEIIAGDSELKHHLILINATLDFIDKIVKIEPHNGEDHLAQLRLVVRCFNSAAASLRLALCGYWQPSFAVMRDLLETYFLLDLFNSNPEKISAWRTLPEKERKSKFGPVHVRLFLDKRDNFKEQKRQKAYELLSKYAAHPTPEGFALISPESMTQVGPFPHETNLHAAFQELAKHLAILG
jgi:hypothetical protein